MTRRLMRAGMWTMTGLALLLGGLTALGLLRATWWSPGRVVIGATSGRVEIAWANCALRRQSIAYNLSYPQGNSSILMAPESCWYPSTASAKAGVGATGGPV